MSSEAISASLEQNVELVIDAQALGKCYHIYERPQDRLKQMLWRGRRCYYREFWALQDISFSVRHGETIGVIGRNGSGKSTLLKLLCNTLTPTTGRMTVSGRVAALLELGTGFNPEFTGRENVYLNAAILGLSDAEIEQYLPEIIEFADIGDFIDQPVKTYSSGMAVRLAFSVIAHVRADILIIDEALAVGDVFFVQKCMRFLREFQGRGTLFFVSHDTSAVVNLCDRVLWLDHGKLQETGSAKDVCEHYLATLRETQQSGGIAKKTVKNNFIKKNQSTASYKSSVETFDQRLSIINQTKFRNDIELFVFRREAKDYGVGAIHIESVQFEKGLLGLAGESGLGLPVVKWVMHGAIADQFPALQSSKDDWQPVLWIDLNGVIHIYERSPIPSIWEDGCCAIGSGREYAMAAMHLGCSAKEAVEVANALSCDCGRGVDVLDLRVAK
jgi:lipopolysaccharide transport system ATP-binding protein